MAQDDSTANTGLLRMKLLIDVESKKVLFAEAGKEVVDFLFSLLALPLATAVGLLGTEIVLPVAIRQLYRSVDNIDSSVLVESSSFTSDPSGLKGELLNPTLSSKLAAADALRLPWDFASSSAPRMPGNHYGCQDTWHYNYMTSIKGVACPRCSKTMEREVHFVMAGNNKNSVTSKTNNRGEKGGIVKGVITYTIADDLTVAPLSTLPAFSVFVDQFHRNLDILKEMASTVEEINEAKKIFEERNVTVGVNEAKMILAASLCSNTVLTHVFVGSEF